ncbi:transposase domain-containing protein [Nonomuraea sp. NPDC046802]|uniref:transposase domain-containing protein n=1 Tax=Nonomuraea sp. NPDC046802 TaxID=3154919 RepID=UPI0033C482AA
MGELGGPGRLTDLVEVGALTSLIPRQVLDAAIAGHECRERRVRKLPAHVVVYLLIALCLFPDDDYEEAGTRTGRSTARARSSSPSEAHSLGDRELDRAELAVAALDVP